MSIIVSHVGQIDEDLHNLLILYILTRYEILCRSVS